MVLQRPAGGPPGDIDGVEIREGRPSDAPAYERDIGTDLAPRVVERLAAPGSSCWLAVRDGRLVHASWTATEKAWVGEARLFFIVPAGDTYIYESFTRPEMRGRGVYPAVLRTIAAHAAGAATGRLWIAAETDNHASLRAIGKAGFTAAFEIEVQRRWGRIRVSVPPGTEPQFLKL